MAPGQVNAAAAGDHQAARDFERRGLARSVGTEQRHDSTARNGEVDAAEHFDPVVGSVHGAKLQRGRGMQRLVRR